MRDRLPLLAGLCVLALALVVAAGSIAGGIRERGKDDTLSVTGSAKLRIVSDHATWQVTVKQQGFTVQIAAADLETWSRRVQTFLDKHGIRPDELTVGVLDIESVTDDNDQISGYTASRTFQVSSDRVAFVAALAQASGKLPLVGVPIQSSSVSYTFTKLAAARPGLLAKAVADAQQRADVLVEATHAHLGKVRGIDVGVFQITAPASTEVSDYGEYDTSSLEKDVTAVVNLTFALG